MSDNYRKTAFNRGLTDLVGEVTLDGWIITGFSVFCIDGRARAFELSWLQLRFYRLLRVRTLQQNANGCKRRVGITSAESDCTKRKVYRQGLGGDSRYHVVGSSDSKRADLHTAFIIDAKLQSMCTRATVIRKISWDFRRALRFKFRSNIRIFLFFEKKKK